MTQWNANLYDQKHQFISNFGENLVSISQPKNGATVTGIDTATSMIAIISEFFQKTGHFLLS